jgi:DNA-binding response OmpR family regulator
MANKPAPWRLNSIYDLVVLDLNLPRLDGVAILQHVRNRKPNVPILILTARGRVEDRAQCLDQGADDDYLVKPFSFSDLSARIRALLRVARLRAEGVRVARCGPYVWLRLKSSRRTTDLLFTSSACTNDQTIAGFLSPDRRHNASQIAG